MLRLALRAAEFLFYKGLITIADRISRLPRDTSAPEPEAMRLYRENIALKAQLDASERDRKQLEKEIRKLEEQAKPKPAQKRKRRPSIRTRASQVLAYVLTRGNEPFQRYFLTAPLGTISRWATRFRFGRLKKDGGRPPVDEQIVELILTLKRENPAWGQRRIREELRRMGIRISEPTIARILREHGFHPRRGALRPDFDRVKADVKDALWALDYFLVRTIKGKWIQSLLIIDVFTRELIDLRALEGWIADSAWTTRVVADAMARTGRKPEA
ncbi:MAG: helix-turn-helix domain-containing protein, partial [Polyangiaceae bacterium]